MLKKLAKRWMYLLIVLIGLNPVVGEASSSDSERLNLELKMQNRVEEALEKILPPGQFVVVIRVEPLPEAVLNAKVKKEDTQSGYLLPGVPSRITPGSLQDEVRNLSSSLKPDSSGFRRFIRQVSATLVLDSDLPDETVTQVRELTRQMLGMDPARGDTLDIQRTSFNKPPSEVLENSGIYRFQKNLRNYWLIISLAFIIICVTVFFLFVFGPLSGFLNRFVQTLRTLKPEESEGNRGPRMGTAEAQLLSALMAQATGSQGAIGSNAISPANFSGSLQVENPNKRTTPFGFIREDHLSNLAVLLSRETPERASVVLGYLPPEWISIVLYKMESSFQSAVTDNLATTKQLLPEQVEDIEQDLKRRLDYLVGGPDRIIAIYESQDPESQKKMLNAIRATQPDLAEQLRSRTLLYEDLEKLPPQELKSVLRDVELQILIASLKGVTEEFRETLLKHMSPGKAEIVRDELDLTDNTVSKATLEARRKVIVTARRLEKEGQIHIPQIEDSAPPTRFGSSLRSTIKLPPTLKLDEKTTPGSIEPGKREEPTDIKNKIRNFLHRQPKTKERFPIEENEASNDK